MTAKKKTPARQKSGGARLVASGKKPVTLGLPPDEYDLLRRAAEKERRPLAQFIVFHALAAAQQALGR